jgi:hypothetical protein
MFESANPVNTALSDDRFSHLDTTDSFSCLSEAKQKDAFSLSMETQKGKI